MSNWQASDIRGKRVIGGVGWPQKGQTLVLDHESYPGMVEKAKAIKIATAKRGQGLESDLQSSCERELIQRGYMRMTPANMTYHAMHQVQGWFAHIVRAERNPIFADLLIFDDRMVRCLHVELKVNPKYSSAQKAMLTSKRWSLAFSLAEFEAKLNEWEADNAR